jgi:hypothetical protein
MMPRLLCSDSWRTHAEAIYNNDDSKVTAIATGGGVAVGSDNQLSQCMPNGGTAMVMSTEGDYP